MGVLTSFLFILAVTFLSILCFSCQQPGDGGGGTGALSYIGSYSNANIDGADSVTVSPAGNHVYVDAYVANAVAWFNRDSLTGINEYY